MREELIIAGLAASVLLYLLSRHRAGAWSASQKLVHLGLELSVLRLEAKCIFLKLRNARLKRRILFIELGRQDGGNDDRAQSNTCKDGLDNHGATTTTPCEMGHAK